MKWLVAFSVAFIVMTGFSSLAEARHEHPRRHVLTHHRHHGQHHRVHHHRHHAHRVHTHRGMVGSPKNVVMLPHPEGCPHVAFCGCGAALDVFGRNVRRLWLAANWYSFPRASPGFNTVGVRPHHVLVLKHQVEGNIWMAADYNSGGHLSRYHAVDISRYTIVNPR